MTRSYLNPTLLALLIIFAVSGCFQNPCPSTGSYNGSVRIRFAIAEQQSNFKIASVAEIRTIMAILTMDKSDLSIQTDPVPFNQAAPEILVNNLYPGKWHVTVNCFDATNTAIYCGDGDVVINSGDTATANLSILPAPGTLQISLDASQIPNFGSNTTGSVYVYEKAQGASLIIKSLSVQGNYLKGEVHIKEGTFMIKVAVPNITKAVFLSSDYWIDIRSGETTPINIAPNGSVTISGMIDSMPTTPSDLTAVYDKTGGKVALHWNPVTDADLSGYHLYRTNSDGTWAHLADPAKEAVSYDDPVTAGNFYNGKITYAVSSFDLGGNESIWSIRANALKN